MTGRFNQAPQNENLSLPPLNIDKSLGHYPGAAEALAKAMESLGAIPRPVVDTPGKILDTDTQTTADVYDIQTGLKQEDDKEKSTAA